MIRFFSVFLSLSLAVPALAQTPCRAEWTVRTSRSQDMMNLSLREIGARGSACDLVLKSMNYYERSGLLSLEVAPARFCPLDVIAERTAKIAWQLPQELRQSGLLRLMVNGNEIGRLKIGEETAFEGGCQ